MQLVNTAEKLPHHVFSVRLVTVVLFFVPVKTTNSDSKEVKLSTVTTSFETDVSGSIPKQFPINCIINPQSKVTEMQRK